MKKISYKKEDNGITLVVLIVTIIILLILAGISILALTHTGLFGKTSEAEEKSKNAKELENLILADYENKIEQVLENTSRDNNANKDRYYAFFLFPNLENTFSYNYLNSISQNMDIRIMNNQNKKAIVLEKNKRYNISYSIRYYSSDTVKIKHGIFDINKNDYILKEEEYSNGWKHKNGSYTYIPDEDKYVVLKFDMSNFDNVTEEYVNNAKLCIVTDYNTIEKLQLNDGIINGTMYPTIKYSEGKLEKTNSTVKLEANKTYRITYEYKLDSPNTEWGNAYLWNYTDNNFIDSSEWCTGDENYKFTVIYNTTKETEVGIKFDRSGGAFDTKIKNDSYIVIDEI